MISMIPLYIPSYPWMSHDILILAGYILFTIKHATFKGLTLPLTFLSLVAHSSEQLPPKRPERAIPSNFWGATRLVI